MYIDTIRARDIDRYYIQGETIIVDLRSKEEYEKAHIPAAVNIPYEDLDDYKQLLYRWKHVILYCTRGNLSLIAARELSKDCSSKLMSVGGGFKAYRQYFSKVY